MMEKIRNRIMKFMQGRYGIDDLYRFLTFLLVVLLILFYVTLNPIINLIELFIFFFAIFRVFSRNFAARTRENDFYLKATKGIRDKVSLFFRRFNDRNSYRYRKCPYCKQTVRLPIKKGRNNVKCPKCGKIFEVKI